MNRNRTPRERMHIENAGVDFRDKIAGINYHIETMMNKTVTMFEYNGLPESLPEREFELMLQTKGKCIVTKVGDEIMALWGYYGGEKDGYYRPKTFLVSNPWLNLEKEFKIFGEGQEAVLVRNDPLDRGLLPIMLRHSAMITETELTMLLADENFRAIFAIVAGTDREKQAALEFLRQVEEGRQGVLMSEGLKEGIGTTPFSNGSAGYITQIIELMQYQKGSFYQEVGLDCNYNMKRERLSESEAGLNADILRPLIDVMLEERQKAIKKINEMFGTNITVKFGSTWAKYNPEEQAAEEKQEEKPEKEDEANEDKAEHTESND